MADRLVLELQVRDDGTPVIKRFGMEGKQALDSVSGSSSMLGGSLGKLKDSWAMMAAGAASVMYIYNQLSSYVSYAVTEFMKQEEAENRLTVAMRNQRDFTIESFEALKDYASAIQSSTAFADDLTLSLMGNLKSYGMTNDEVKRSTQVALDFAAAKKNEGMTAESAAELIGRAYTGMTQTLSRYGIQVEDTGDRTKKFEAILHQLELRFGGAAQSELDTYSGRWKNLKNVIGDTAESVGKFILDVLHGGPIIEQQTAALNRNREMMIQTEYGMVRFTDQVSPKMVEELRREANAWDAFTGTVATFKPVSDETNKALEKMGKDLEKVRIETEFLGKAESLKAIAMIQAEVREMEKAGIEKEKITEYVAAKTSLIQITAAKKASGAYSQITAAAYDDFDKMLATPTEVLEGQGKAVVNSVWEPLKQATNAYFDNFNTRYDQYETMLAATPGELEQQARDVLNVEPMRKALVSYKDQFKETYDELDQMMAAPEGKLLSTVIATRDERWKIERSLMEDISKLTKNEYEFKKDSILRQAELYKQSGADRMRVEEWLRVQLIRLEEERVLRSNDFWGGMRVAYQQDLREQEKWGERGATIWRGIFGKGGAFESVSQSFFVDLFHGQLKTAEDYFNAFKDSVINAIAKMLAEWLAFQVAMQVGGWLGLSPGVGGGGAPGGGGGGIFTSSGGAGNNAAASAGNMVVGQTTNALIGYGLKSAGSYLASALGLSTSATVAASTAAPTAASIAAEYGAISQVAAGSGAAAAGGGSTASAGAAGASGSAAGVLLPAAIIAYGYFTSQTQRLAMNPFQKNADFQSQLGAFLASPPILPDTPGVYSSGAPTETEKLAAIFGDSWFDPENLYQIYGRSTGIWPKGYGDFAAANSWLLSQPQAVAAQRAAEEYWRQHYSAFSDEGGMWVNYFGEGGIIREPVYGVGKSGRRYVIGEKGPEKVTPMKGGNGGGNTYILQFNGPVFAEEQYVAEMILPAIRKLEKWGH